MREETRTCHDWGMDMDRYVIKVEDGERKKGERASEVHCYYHSADWGYYYRIYTYIGATDCGWWPSTTDDIVEDD